MLTPLQFDICHVGNERNDIGFRYPNWNTDCPKLFTIYGSAGEFTESTNFFSLWRKGLDFKT